MVDFVSIEGLGSDAKLFAESPGIIGIASGFLGRYREFDVCVNRTQMPVGSQRDWRVGVGIAMNFNHMVCRTLGYEKYKELCDVDFQWLWILGDDHVWSHDLLLKLLQRDVDVVVPLCLRRLPKYSPVLFAGRDGGYKPLGWEDINGKTGLVKLETELLGNAGMLIKRHVLETLKDPWFENGKMNSEMSGCDLWFCQKVHDVGFELHLDLDNTIGHLTHLAIWPRRDEENNYNPDIRTPIGGPTS